MLITAYPLCGTVSQFKPVVVENRPYIILIRVGRGKTVMACADSNRYTILYTML